MAHRIGRPKQKPARATALITRRVRKLIDLAYEGNIRLASLTTGLPYATLRDLYIGRTVNPSIATLEVLAARHGFPMAVQWFLREDQGEDLPLGGVVILLPAAPGQPQDLKHARESFIPYAAWPLVQVYELLYDYLLFALQPSKARPILGTATGGKKTSFRLTRFLFAPLLEAERQGERGVIQADWLTDKERWVKSLQALGRLWEQAMPDLLAKARAYARQRGSGPRDWMGYNPDREGPGGRPKESV